MCNSLLWLIVGVNLLVGLSLLNLFKVNLLQKWKLIEPKTLKVDESCPKTVFNPPLQLNMGEYMRCWLHVV